MSLTNDVSLILALSGVAGAVQVLAPDRWLPASVLAWQRGWSLPRTMFFAFIALVLHLLAGFVVYECLQRLLLGFDFSRLYVFTLLLVFGLMLFRLIRFSKINQVIHSGPHGSWAMFLVLSLLGPCEAIIPILIKAKILEIDTYRVFLVFGIGTTVTGMIAVGAGRLLWNKPRFLPRGVELGYRGVALVPVTAVLVVSLSAILKVGS